MSTFIYFGIIYLIMAFLFIVAAIQTHHPIWNTMTLLFVLIATFDIRMALSHFRKHIKTRDEK